MDYEPVFGNLDYQSQCEASFCSNSKHEKDLLLFCLTPLVSAEGELREASVCMLLRGVSTEGRISTLTLQRSYIGTLAPLVEQ